MTKLHYEQVSDFVERWSDADAGRFEFVLSDGQRIVAQECYLSRDQAGRPDRVCVNYDSPSYSKLDFDPLDVSEVYDIDQQCALIAKSNQPPPG